MKTPRNLTGLDLVKLLKSYNYFIPRQTGSHIRLKTNKNGEHHITIPKHNPLKTGTLNSILKDISNHFGITTKELFDDLFNR